MATRRLLRPIFVFLFSLLVWCSAVKPAKAADFNITKYTNTIPLAGKSYGDVWGEGNIACLGIWLGYSNLTYYGVGTYSITNPAAPVLLSTYVSADSFHHNQFEQGVVRNRIGYFGSWSGGGVHIVSLTNPSTPIRLSRITASTSGVGLVTNGFDRVHTLFLDRNFLYEAAHVDNTQSVKVFNISNPFAPVFVANIFSTNVVKVHQITAATNEGRVMLYTSGWGNSTGTAPGQTDIWDVTDIGTQPAQWKGRIYSGYSSHSSWPTPDGKSLVVCRETSGGEATIYDITNPANPTILFAITPQSMGLENNLPHNPVIVGNLLFVSWYQNGIQAFDITDRTKPVRIGSFDTYLTARSSSFQGNWGIFPFLGLNKLLLSDIQTGFYTADASAILTGTNNYAPLLIKSPVSLITNVGASVTFAPVLTGSSLNYQWRFNTTNIAGAVSSSYTIPNAQTNDSGGYSVIAYNASGSVTSAPGNLSLVLNNSAPVITAQPQSVAAYPEQSVLFSVAVLGGTPMSFQWRLGGVNIPNATNSTYSIPSVHSSQAGTYQVFITNSFGSTLSSSAFLYLIDSPYISGVRSIPGYHSALVSWTTTLPTDGIVDYGPVSAGSITASSPRDTILSTNHCVLLTGLTQGTAYNFQVVSRAGGTNYLSAVYQFATGPAPMILDNTDTGRVSFSGTWSTSSSTPGYYGIDYAFANTSATTARLATYTPNILLTGKYDIDVSYTVGTNRAPNAPYTISHANGTSVITKNQQTSAALWNPLATEVTFNAGTTGFVRLDNNATANVVIADAMRFTYSANQPLLSDGNFPSWWSGFYFEGAVDPNVDHDGDGFSTGDEYILGTVPTSAANKLNVKVFRSGATANVIVHPLHNGRVYTLQQRSSLSGSSWQPATFNSFTATDDGEGVYSVALNSATQSYYRISVELSTPSPVSPALGRNAVVQERRMFRGSFDEPSCGPGRIYAE